MLRKIATATMFVLLFTAMLTFAFKLQPIKAQSSILIDSDGTIIPDDGRIVTDDNYNYRFTEDIYDRVSINRWGAVIDGCGFSLDGYLSPDGSGFWIYPNISVTIKNTTITNWDNYGIFAAYNSSAYIYENNITKNEVGVYLNEQTESWPRICHNNITENTGDGVYITKTGYDFFMIYYNNISSNGECGIRIEESPKFELWFVIPEIDPAALIFFNTIEDNLKAGISLTYCKNVWVFGNFDVNRNYCGIRLESSWSNPIFVNYLYENIVSGIELHGSSENNVQWNNITGLHYFLPVTQDGIFLNSSHYNQIIYNNVSWNVHGIRYKNSNNNNITGNNFMYNMWNKNESTLSILGSSVNYWDNGYAGNFWDDYFAGSGYDDWGIGIDPYVIDESNADNYPLGNPYIEADVNHDGVVNMRDIGAACGAFNTMPPEQMIYQTDGTWIPHCDINEDGIVNMRDIGMACLNFMDDCWNPKPPEPPV